MSEPLRHNKTDGGDSSSGDGDPAAGEKEKAPLTADPDIDDDLRPQLNVRFALHALILSCAGVAFCVVC